MSSIRIIILITQVALQYNVPPELAVAVAKVESGFNTNATSPKGARGLFQLMPNSFPNVDPEDLYNPEVNIKLGVKYLAWTKNNCKHKQGKYDFLVCYNYGVKNAEHVRYPRLFPYYKKVMKEMKEQ